MRTAPSGRARARAIALTALGLCGVLAVPVGGAALAAPAPADVTVGISAAEKQLANLGHRIDAAVEDYNNARIALAAAQRRAEAASGASARARRDFTVQQQHLAGFAVSAYQDGATGDLTAMVTSTPAEYLDRMSTLKAVSEREAEILRAVDAARRTLTVRDEEAASAASAALAVTSRLAATKESIQTQIADETRLLISLRGVQARERQLAAAKAAAASAAAQQPRSSTSSSPTPSGTETRSTHHTPRRSPAPSSHVPVSGRAAAAVSAAYSVLGKPYYWGASGPNSFDCSGLTMWAWGRAGVGLPHSSSAQYGSGTHVSKSALQPGDLLFFYTPISHVGMYVGGGMMIDSPHSGSVVSKVTPQWGDFVGAVRPG